MVAKTLLLAIVFALALPAQAQGYPSRPIRIIDAYPPGGASDTQARILAERLVAKWGQPVIVENRSGAGGNIGFEAVFKADPDGYTLLSALPPLATNKRLNAKLAYDPDAFAPIALVTLSTNVLLVHPKVKASSVKELFALAKAQPDRLNYASTGNAHSGHVQGELLKTTTGIKMVHVPYQGAAPALTALVAGQVDMMFVTLGASRPHIRSGKLRALAVTSEQRHPLLPDVPTMSETLPGFVSVGWWGLVAPPRTPPEIVNKLSGAIAEVLKQAEVAKKLTDMGATPYGSTPAEMSVFMKREADRLESVIRSGGVKLEAN